MHRLATPLLLTLMAIPSLADEEIRGKGHRLLRRRG
jgi:hypothetical protein